MILNQRQRSWKEAYYRFQFLLKAGCLGDGRQDRVATVAAKNMGHSSMRLMHKASLKALVQHQNSGTMCLPAIFKVPSNNEALNKFYPCSRSLGQPGPLDLVYVAFVL